MEGTQNENLRKAYSPLNIVRVKKSRKIRWVKNVELVEATRNSHQTLVHKTDEKNALKIILKLTLNKTRRRMWSVFS
jgi:hypothetical protein